MYSQISEKSYFIKIILNHREKHLPLRDTNVSIWFLPFEPEIYIYIYIFFKTEAQYVHIACIN